MKFEIGMDRVIVCVRACVCLCVPVSVFLKLETGTGYVLYLSLHW